MITMVTIIPNAGHLNLHQGHDEDAQEDAQDVAKDVHQHYGDQGDLEIGFHQRCRKQGTHVSFAKEDTSLYIVQLLESFQLLEYQMDDGRLYLTWPCQRRRKIYYSGNRNASNVSQNLSVICHLALNIPNQLIVVVDFA